MRGETEPSRMGNALTVTDEDVGPGPEPMKGFDQGGPLSEGEIAWNIGERSGKNAAGEFDKIKAVQIENSDDADGYVTCE